jgi:membrane protease subunit HflC
MRYVIPVVVIVLALLGAKSLYVVGEGHAAALSRFGKVEATGIGPGLHVRQPFMQEASVYDTRAITSQAEPGDCKTRDDETVRVGFSLRWRIADPVAYFDATSGDELQATQQMEPLIRDALRQRVAHEDLSALLVATDGSLGAAVRRDVADAIRNKLGIEVLGVGIGRVLPPEDALAAVYKRMTAEAQAAAGSVRADGEAAAAARVDAAASAKDPRFFRYWSSLNTWRRSFGDGGAVVVLDRNSPFLQAIDAGTASDGPATKKH